MRKVRATRRGHYLKLREIGDEFEIADDIIPGSWMKVLEVPRPEPPPARPRARGRDRGSDVSDLL